MDQPVYLRLHEQRFQKSFSQITQNERPIQEPSRTFGQSKRDHPEQLHRAQHQSLVILPMNCCREINTSVHLKNTILPITTKIGVVADIKVSMIISDEDRLFFLENKSAMTILVIMYI